MAKPINLYQGAASAAMGQMGQGILEAGARIGQTIQSGYESMGKGLAGGINAAVGEYAKHKDDQAKFDATKKVFTAFEDFLPKTIDPETGKDISPMGETVKAIFADTSMSVREKNALAPMLFSFLGNAQQQAGKENIANIMAGSRLDVAAAKNPPKPAPPAFNPAPDVDPFSLPLPTAPSQAAPQMLQPQSTPPPQMQQQNANKMPLTRFNEQTRQNEFWNPKVKRYIPEPVDFGLNPFE
jgi:hypothetical protein